MHASSSRLSKLYAGAFVAAAMSAPAWGQSSSLTFISEPGDPIGMGQELTLTDVRTGRAGESQILLEASNAEQWFYLVLTAPAGETLKRGKYEDVVLPSVSRTLAQPGLNFYGNDGACESVEGRFEIDEIRFAAFGYVERLRAHFEQRCDGSTATLWGDVIVDNPPMPAEMKVKLRVEPQVPMDSQFGPTEAWPYIHLTCEYPTGGRVELTLEQSHGAERTITGRMFDRVLCGPTPLRIQIPISSDSGSDFRAGKATLTVEARMEDPNYSEYETDAEVVRQVTRRVRLRD